MYKVKFYSDSVFSRPFSLLPVAPPCICRCLCPTRLFFSLIFSVSYELTKPPNKSRYRGATHRIKPPSYLSVQSPLFPICSKHVQFDVSRIMIWLEKQNYGLGHCILGLKVGSGPVKIVQHFCYPAILYEKYIALWPFPTFAKVFWATVFVSAQGRDRQFCFRAFTQWVEVNISSQFLRKTEYCQCIIWGSNSLYIF